MNSFVIIFRQGPFNLTDAVKQTRAAAIGVWVREVVARGHKLIPHALGAEVVRHEPTEYRGTAGDEYPITALLFIEAGTLAEVGELASSHPALQYNVRIEVRQWTTPSPLPPA